MIGKLLRTMRKSKKLKQSDITKITGIPQNTLSQYETGVIIPKFSDVERITKVCGYLINFVDTNSEKVLNTDNINREEI